MKEEEEERLPSTFVYIHGNDPMTNTKWSSADDGLSSEDTKTNVVESTNNNGNTMIDPLAASNRSTPYSVSDSIPAELRRSPKKNQMDGLVLLQNSKKRQRQRKVSEFTINKLKFHSLGLVGREKEIATLKSCYHCIQEEGEGTISKIALFLYGFSGVGKSKLAQCLQQEVLSSSSKRALFVQGKYDFTTMDEPLSGIAQAYGNLCHQIQTHQDSNLVQAVRDSIQNEMPEEAELLTELLPELAVLLHKTNDVDSTSTKHTTSNNTLPWAPSDNEKRTQQEHWRHALRILTRILGQFFHPMIMVLDDLQWSDVASLDVLEYLMTDVQNSNPFLMIGCYRSNEVDEQSLLHQRIQGLRQKSERFGFGITDLEVQSCNVNAVNQMIMCMMSIDDEEETRDLAEVCYKRTLGNPFFLIEFMKMLQSEGLLEFHLGLLKWVYDVSKIEDATMSTANVVDLLQTRMRKRLTDDMQVLLQYAACLGSSFSPSTLRFLWKENKNIILKDDGFSNVDNMLELAQQENFVEACGSDQLRWVHDKVQEAALSLSDLVTPSFQFELGLCLYHGLAQKELDKQIFDITDLINKGAGVSRSELAALNLRTAKKALRTAAFVSASRYVANGIRFLPSDSWNTHRQLTLGLYSRGAEIEFTIGNVETTENYVTEVVQREECTLIESMPVQTIKMRMLMNQQITFDEVIDHGLALLNQLEFKLIWNRTLVKVQALVLAIKTIKTVKRLPLDHFASLGKMKDPKHRAIANIISILRVAAYNSENGIFFTMICSCKMVELTLAHGLSDYSAPCLAGLANAALFLKQDYAATLQFSEMAMLIHEKHSGSRVAETVFALCGHCLARVKPLHECLPMIMKGYTHGARSGEIEWCLFNLLGYFVTFPYVMGKALGPIQEQLPKILPQVEEAKLKYLMLVVRIFWQLIVNLQSIPNKESMTLDGDIFHKDDNQAALGNVYVATLHLAENELLVFSGAFEELAQRDIDKGDLYSELLRSSYKIPMEAFHRGVALYAMAQRTKARKYRTRANRIQKMVSKWAKAKNPNVQHYDLMLRAEQAAMTGRKDGVADALYKEAIVCAARTGHLQHVALFHERYAEYRLNEHSDVDDAKYHLSESIKYYSEWGALGKAEVLRKEMDALL